MDETRRLRFVGIALLVFSAVYTGTLAYAQLPEEPSVQINTSVLNELRHYHLRTEDHDGLEPTRLRRPSEAVDTQGNRPSQWLSSPQQSETHPIPARESVQKPINEAVPRSSTLKVPPNTLKAPIPARKPERSQRQAAKASSIAPQKQGLNAPIPARRPDRHMASAEFVEQARRNQGYQISGEKIAGVPAMPAVPPVAVQSEIVFKPPPDASEDTLLAYMTKTMNREQIIAGINEAAARTHRQANIEQEKYLSKTDASPHTMSENSDDAKKIVKIKAEKNGQREIIRSSSSTKGTEISHATRAAAISERPVPRLPPAAAYDGMDYLTLPFKSGQDEVDSFMKDIILNEVIPVLRDNLNIRLQVQSFASLSGGQGNSARRLSLSRALSIRNFLVEQGIDPRRMEVRAMGSQSDRSPADRIDFVFLDEAV